MAKLISDRIAPRLLPEIEILPWRRTQVLAVQVHPSPSRPHYLAREGLACGVYVRLVTEHQCRKVPTVGGMILFGKDRERHFPDAWIQAGRFDGADNSRIIDRTEIRTFPVRAIEEAIAFVQKHPLHVAEIGSVRRKERWSLPPVALREAVMNAVVQMASRFFRFPTSSYRYFLFFFFLDAFTCFSIHSKTSTISFRGTEWPWRCSFRM